MAEIINAAKTMTRKEYILWKEMFDLEDKIKEYRQILGNYDPDGGETMKEKARREGGLAEKMHLRNLMNHEEELKAYGYAQLRQDEITEELGLSEVYQERQDEILEKIDLGWSKEKLLQWVKETDRPIRAPKSREDLETWHIIR